MTTESVVKKGRKAIYVDVPVFEKFREESRKDGRKYSAFLESLLKRRRGGSGK